MVELPDTEECYGLTKLSYTELRAWMTSVFLFTGIMVKLTASVDYGIHSMDLRNYKKLLPVL